MATGTGSTRGARSPHEAHPFANALSPIFVPSADIPLVIRKKKQPGMKSRVAIVIA